MAETVTISTFLELKDNMSAGLKQVEAALTRLNQAMQSAGKAGAKDPAAKAAQAHAKATAFAAKMERQRSAMAERAATREIHAAQRAMDAKIKASATATRHRIADERRVAREASRAAVRQAKAAENARRDRSDFIGKAGAAMFGPGVGGIISAYMGGGMGAAGPLAAITALEAALGGVKKAAEIAFDAIQRFTIKVFEVGQRYQNDVRNIALTLRGLDVTPTFNLGKQSAQDLYETMRVLAAKLPGETQDYMSVFGFGLPTALDAGLKKSESHLKDYAKFVSKFTAYGFVRGVTDPFHLGRDLERLQQGKVIGQTRMFKELKPFLDHAIRGTREFNQLAADVRMAHVFKAVEKATGGIDETLYDADALLGTMNSEITRIFQVGGKPLFGSSLRIIERINEYLIKNNSLIVQMVSLVSTDLGHSFEGVADIVLGLGGKLRELVPVLSVLDDVLKSVSASYAILSGGVQVGRALTAHGAAIADEREQRRLQEKSLKERGLRADPLVQQEYYKLEKLINKSRIVPFSRPGGMSPAPGTVWTGTTFSRVPALQAGPTSGYGTAESLERIKPRDVAERSMVYKEAVKIAKANKLSGESFGAMFKPLLADTEITRAWQEAQQSIQGGFEPTEEKKKTRKTPAGRQQTINDFRFSKFDIKQEFAEGFDPDRIAVAFASDLAKLGEMRMQSAYAPLFAVRLGV